MTHFKMSGPHFSFWNWALQIWYMGWW